MKIRNGVTWRLVFVTGLLSFATCGLLLFDRGFFQDDAASLFNALRVADSPWHMRLHAPEEGPTRLISLIPYSLAIETARPVRTLQCMLIVTWAAIAILTAALARRLRPDRPGITTSAGLLAATASSDFLTGSIVGLGYQIGVAMFLAAIVAAFDYTRRGYKTALLLSSAALLISLWTIDVAALTYPLIPLLFAWSADRGIRKRAFALAVVWFVITVPYVLAFTSFMGGSYARFAIQPQAALQAPFALISEQILHNFQPWQWGPTRMVYAPPPDVLPVTVFALIAVLATVLGVWAWRRDLEHEAPTTDAMAPPRRGTAVTLALFLAIANAPMAFLVLRELHYRTHTLSRIWACLLIAFLADWLVRRRRRGLAIAGYALVSIFLFGGVWGGLERQNYYASLWIDHRTELTSILDAVPALPPGQQVLLVVPRHLRWMATEAEYLAKAWMSLLYEDASIADRVHVAVSARNTGCRTEAGGLRCWGETMPACTSEGPCGGPLLPYSTTIVLQYDPRRGTYARVPQFAGFASPVVARADPAPHRLRDALLIPVESTPWARDLLRLGLEDDQPRFTEASLAPIPYRDAIVPGPGASIDAGTLQTTTRAPDVRGSIDRITVQGRAVETAPSMAEFTVEGWGLVNGRCPSAVVVTANGDPVAVTTSFVDGCRWRSVVRGDRLRPGKYVIKALVAIEGDVREIDGQRELRIGTN